MAGVSGYLGMKYIYSLLLGGVTQMKIMLDFNKLAFIGVRGLRALGADQRLAPEYVNLSLSGISQAIHGPGVFWRR